MGRESLNGSGPGCIIVFVCESVRLIFSILNSVLRFLLCCRISAMNTAIKHLGIVFNDLCDSNGGLDCCP